MDGTERFEKVKTLFHSLLYHHYDIWTELFANLYINKQLSTIFWYQEEKQVSKQWYNIMICKDLKIYTIMDNNIFQ